MAAECPEIDIILGGHDHVFYYNIGNNNVIIKSGTDFRELTLNTVRLSKYKQDIKPINNSDHITYFDKNDYTILIDTQSIKVTKDLPKNEKINKLAKLLQDQTEQEFKTVIGRLSNTIDARFPSVRTRSLPITNFVCDLLRIYMNTDCSFLNSGTLRIDSDIQEGELK